jgi:hypothetical protein
VASVRERTISAEWPWLVSEVKLSLIQALNDTDNTWIKQYAHMRINPLIIPDAQKSISVELPWQQNINARFSFKWHLDQPFWKFRRMNRPLSHPEMKYLPFFIPHTNYSWHEEFTVLLRIICILSHSISTNKISSALLMMPHCHVEKKLFPQIRCKCWCLLINIKCCILLFCVLYRRKLPL